MAFHALVKRFNFAKTLLVSCQLETFRAVLLQLTLCAGAACAALPQLAEARFLHPSLLVCAGVLLNTYPFHPRRAEMMGVAAGESSGPDPIGRSCAAAAPLPEACALRDVAQ